MQFFEISADGNTFAEGRSIVEFEYRQPLEWISLRDLVRPVAQSCHVDRFKWDVDTLFSQKDTNASWVWRPAAIKKFHSEIPSVVIVCQRPRTLFVALLIQF